MISYSILFYVFSMFSDVINSAEFIWLVRATLIVEQIMSLVNSILYVHNSTLNSILLRREVLHWFSRLN